MLKALAIKELRESAGLVALAVLASVFMLAELTGMPLLPWSNGQPVAYPFVNDGGLYFYLWLIAGGLGVLLGLKQSAWELWQGSYYFLLHRPTGRKQVFGTKLAIGGGLLLTITAAAILIYALWAAAPGHHASPFFWSMTGAAWQFWFATPLVYLGAFFSGIRPGRWYGSRLAPLAAGIALAMLVAFVPWWWLGVVIGIVATVAYLAAIFLYVESRDY